MRLRRATALFVFAVAAASCGGAQPRTLSCPEDGAEIRNALRSGLPTYDYNPAVDLNDLVHRGDVVVSGVLRTAVRESVDDVDWTVLEVSDVRVLAGEVAQPITTFSTESVWAVRGEIDPLGATVTFEELRFFAVLERFEPAIGGYWIDVQGLHVTCDPASGRLHHIIEPLPDPARGSTLNTLVATLS